MGLDMYFEGTYSTRAFTERKFDDRRNAESHEAGCGAPPEAGTRVFQSDDVGSPKAARGKGGRTP